MSLPPPVSRHDYHYFNGDFLITSSNQNRHRRASIQELQILFHPAPGQAPVKDHPAHWYRAQLLHYGLQPSDNKGTAAKRLLDALNQGILAVPAHLQRLEKELKKEWDANVRKAKKELADAQRVTKAQAEDAAGKCTKRKADHDNLAAAITAAAMTGLSAANVQNANININVNIGGDPNQATTTPQSTKKRKADESQDVSRVKKPAATKAITPANALSSQPTSSDTQPTAIGNHPRPLQTARRSRPFRPGGVSRSASSANSAANKDAPEQTAKKQTARSTRAGYGAVQSRTSTNASSPVEGSPKSLKHRNTISPKSHNPKLGLINGTYCVEVNVAGLDLSNSGITLCLEDTSVWGEFQIGHLTGVLFMPERPYNVFHPDRDDVHEACFFRWRATDRSRGYAPIAGRLCTGTMKFLGDGTIEGTFEHLLADASGELFDCDFRAQRHPGQGTKIPRSARNLREEFEAIERNAGGYFYEGEYPNEPPPPYEPNQDEDTEMMDVSW
ncbi:hypothetical protein ATEIFO6365_0003009800 [Aspergillus terreus]|uniref:Uncharacterized protein n=1 Tax=Aspergillus terreus TaxID=33178 RepID=A0A5M3YR45_ASPTE|nr:hypothetical protein ATETN484_0003003700 [Aspergillus terreus]GFF14045.1 hypothetical protein ATEIFO6365_0003009800 [Aspergillus terreus]